MSPELPGESERLQALRECSILDTPPEAPFDDLVKLAAHICEAPMAAVTFIDDERQWFKARVGLAQGETPRSDSICETTIYHEGPLVVPDVQRDARFLDKPFQRRLPSIGFYAGVPLRVDGGPALGSLCVMDDHPRQLTPQQLTALEMLGAHVMRELRLRRELATARRQQSTDELPIREGDWVARRWHLVRRIGQGTTGIVFEAQDRDGQRVAIKFLRPQWLSSGQVIERFAREARVLAKLRSPHVNRILDLGNLELAQGELPYLVLEFLEGDSLEAVLAARRQVPWPQVARWVLEACQGLEEVHRRGVVHRDIKPGNLFLARGEQGEQATVKLVDFGIAEDERAPSRMPLESPSGQVGSLAYLAPEQLDASGAASPQSDIWALGVLLYEMITGRLPFDGSSPLELCVSVLERTPRSLRATRPETPESLDTIVARCLQRHPGARYEDVQKLALELRKLLREATAA